MVRSQKKPVREISYQDFKKLKQLWQERRCQTLVLLLPLLVVSFYIGPYGPAFGLLLFWFMSTFVDLFCGVSGGILRLSRFAYWNRLGGLSQAFNRQHEDEVVLDNTLGEALDKALYVIASQGEFKVTSCDTVAGVIRAKRTTAGSTDVLELRFEEVDLGKTKITIRNDRKLALLSLQPTDHCASVVNVASLRWHLLNGESGTLTPQELKDLFKQRGFFSVISQRYMTLASVTGICLIGLAALPYQCDTADYWKYFNSGDYSKAVAQAKKLERCNPDRSTYLRGIAEAEARSFASAVATFDRVIKETSVPQYLCEARSGKAVALARSGDLLGALKECNQAANDARRFDPGLEARGTIDYAYGVISSLMGNREQALHYLSESIELSNNPAAYRERARLLLDPAAGTSAAATSAVSTTAGAVSTTIAGQESSSKGIGLEHARLASASVLNSGDAPSTQSEPGALEPNSTFAARFEADSDETAAILDLRHAAEYEKARSEVVDWDLFLVALGIAAAMEFLTRRGLARFEESLLEQEDSARKDGTSLMNLSAGKISDLEKGVSILQKLDAIARKSSAGSAGGAHESTRVSNEDVVADDLDALGDQPDRVSNELYESCRVRSEPVVISLASQQVTEST